MKPTLAAISFALALGLGPIARDAITTLDLSHLNEASRQFVIHLQYLIQERRLIKPEALTRLLTSLRPVNPVEGRSSVQLLPHSEAFNELLREDLQWPEIQQAIRALIGAVTQNEQRAEVASEETHNVLVPLPVRTLPNKISRVIRTASGQTVAIALRSVWTPKNESTFITAYDLATGSQLKVSVFSGATYGILDQPIEQDGRILTVIPNSTTREMITFDLLTGAVISHPVMARGINQQGSLMPYSRFVKVGGKATILVLEGNSIVLLDPLTGQEFDRIPFDENSNYSPNFFGMVGDLIYSGSFGRTTHLIDPSRQKPNEEENNFIMNNSFSAQGQLHALGYDKTKASGSSILHMNFRNMSTKTDSKIFDVAASRERPWLVGGFEQSGKVSAVIASDVDTVRVNALTGEIEQKLSETPFARRLHFASIHLDHRPAVITYRGQPYFIATLDGEGGASQQLVIVDPLTFQPTSVLTPLGTRVVMDEVLLVPGTEEAPQVIVNFNDGTSTVFSLVNPI